MKYDAVVIGAGPNGLSAAIEIARNGKSVLLLEAKDTLGGGARSAELTLPGFVHDVCAAIHPMAAISPFFQDLHLETRGVEWIHSPAAVAHPMPDGEAAFLFQDLHQTAGRLGRDTGAYKELFAPFSQSALPLFSQILRPIRWPRQPLFLAKFGWHALRSCESLVKSHFEERATQALLAGCAAHSFLPLDAAGSASFGLALIIAAHAAGWPFAAGGSQRITDALASCLKDHGGEIQTGKLIGTMNDLPEARIYLFDVTPRQLLSITGELLPQRYRKKLSRYRYGPGVFKMDWAMSGPIPWKSTECGKAATVHVGGTFEQIAHAEAEVAAGKHPDQPFVLLAQQSLFDPSRAPLGRHTAWGYCHVPNGSSINMTEKIEQQVERFAPGFRDLILARHTFNSSGLEEHNPNFVGGDVSGGANHLRQFLGRPLFRLDPYSTPNPKIYLCSSSTPPGGGVHGMCGYNAARSVLKNIFDVTLM